MRYTILTLGCKVNQYESQAMEQWLRERGHTEVPPEAEFDLGILNTCTVTAVADKKNRNMIRRLRKQCPDAVLAVCGCYSQIKPEDVRALGADVIAGSGGREAFLRLALETAADRQRRELLDDAMRRREFELLPPGGLSARTRAMLKVQDGCSNFCSYCVIPYARGPVRSLPAEQAVAQVEALCRSGYREIVVTGIEIASWGVDLDQRTGRRERLPELIDAVCRTAARDPTHPVRVRLGSLEPRIVDEKFCLLLRHHRNLCPHFHLSMQSGSDGVLLRMRRKYNTARYEESVKLLRTHFPGCAVTTDMIVGFPGETDEEFQQSLDFIRRCGFASMHIFPYSRRPGTPADRMPGQLGNAVKAARSAAAMSVAAEMNRRFREAMVGTVQAVLFEQNEGDLCTGHAPNSIRVYVPEKDLHNQALPIRITGLYEDGVFGERAGSEQPL